MQQDHPLLFVAPVTLQIIKQKKEEQYILKVSVELRLVLVLFMKIDLRIMDLRFPFQCQRPILYR